MQDYEPLFQPGGLSRLVWLVCMVLMGAAMFHWFVLPAISPDTIALGR